MFKAYSALNIRGLSVKENQFIL